MPGTRRLVLLARRGRPCRSTATIAAPRPFPQSDSRRHGAPNSRAAANGWPRAASPTSSSSCPEKFTIYPEHLPAWVRSRRSRTPYDRVARRDRARRPRRVRRPAPAAARGQGARARLFPDRLALELQRRDRRLRRRSCAPCSARCRRASLPAIAPAPRPAYVPGVDFYSGDSSQMLGLPSRVREDDVAPLGKVLGDAASRCARRIDKGEIPGFEILRLRPARPAARGRLCATRWRSR